MNDLSKNCNIVFFGSGDFPVPTFKSLIACGYNITGLVTSHDKVFFNDKRICEIAWQHGIPTYIPDGLSDKEFIDWLWEKNADMFCVISYKVLPERLLRIPYIIAFNVHASLLPFLKGPDPIYWAIRNGFKTTGLTSFVLDSKIDNGDIISSMKINVEDNETYGTLHQKMSEACRKFTIGTIEKLLNAPDVNDCVISQPVYDGNLVDKCGELFHAPKLKDKDRILYGYDDFSERDINEVCAQLRALLPNRGMMLNFMCQGDGLIPFKIWDYELHDVDNLSGEFSTIVTDKKNYLGIHTRSNPSKILFIKTIQRLSGKRMDIKSFLRGFKYFNGNNKKEYSVTVCGDVVV